MSATTTNAFPTRTVLAVAGIVLLVTNRKKVGRGLFALFCAADDLTIRLFGPPPERVT